MSIEPTKEEEPNSIVIITSNVISTNKKVTVMRIVHTNDCFQKILDVCTKSESHKTPISVQSVGNNLGINHLSSNMS